MKCGSEEGVEGGGSGDGSEVREGGRMEWEWQ